MRMICPKPPWPLSRKVLSDMPGNWDCGNSQVWGPRIENRGSQITFSALGQFAPVAAKQAWDRDNTKKQALVEAVKADLPHMRVRAGGYTSVDVSECGIDKPMPCAS